MKPKKTLNVWLEENKEEPIQAIASFMEEYITESWQAILHEHHGKLLEAYEKAGDAAYGTFLNLLFIPVHRQFKAIGLRPEPNFPGNFEVSREWGNLEETDQQRWMWSVVLSPEKQPLGTIVTIVYHDHSRFHVPRQPRILAIEETEKDDIVAALSLLSPDFKEALEFTEEYERYLQAQGNNSEK